MTDLVKRMRRVGYADVANHIEKIEADLCKSQEALDTIMNSNMVEALEAESDEFERTVMKLELAEDRIEALEAALRKAQEALVPFINDFRIANATHTEIEKVLK